jgi:hypothetical protein
MKVDPRDLQFGPIRHETLPDELIARIRVIRAALLRVHPQSMEFWLDGFKRDVHPEKEILWWERLSASYLEYFWVKCRDEKQAKSAFRLLVHIGAGNEVLSTFEDLSEEDVSFLKVSAATLVPPFEIEGGYRSVTQVP